MTEWLFNLIPGGGISVIVAGIATALVALFGLFKTVQKTGVDKQKAKEAEARAKNIDDVRRAQSAGDAARRDDTGELSDPNNRDLRR